MSWCVRPIQRRIEWLATIIVVLASGGAYSQSPNGTQELRGQDVPIEDAVWAQLISIGAQTDNDELSKVEVVAYVQARYGVNAEAAEALLVYAAEATKALYDFGAELMDEFVCSREASIISSSDLGRALNERSRLYRIRLTELAMGVADVLSAGSQEIFLSRVEEARSRMTMQTTFDYELAFEGRSTDSIKASISSACSIGDTE